MAAREAPPRARTRWAVLGALAAILLLALWLRAHQLDRESVWYDEYISIAKIQPTGLIDTIREQRKWDWYMTPLYHTLQYAWWNMTGQTPGAVRWLSILFGIGAILVLYRITRELYGISAGLTAALLMALSPFHIYHAQGIRSYALLLLLGLVSVWCFLRATREGGRRWWIAHVAANVLLLWTHLLAVLILVPQGLYLLLCHRKSWWRVVLWAGVNGVVVLSVLAWITSISGGAGSPKVSTGPVKIVFDTLLRNDPGPLTWMDYVLPKDAPPGDISPRVWRVMGLREGWGMQSARMIGEKWLGRAYLMLVVFFALALAWHRARPSPCGNNRVALRESLFVALWWVVPVVLLYMLARATQLALFEQRFLIYCTPALYVVAGGAVSRLNPPSLRVLVAGALALLLSVQTFAYEYTPVRHGYLPAARHIKASAAPGQTVITHLLYPNWLLDYNLGAHDFELIRTDSEEQLLQTMRENVQRSGSVWVVLLATPEHVGAPDQAGLAERFESALDAGGIRHDKRVFPGMQNVYTYYCRPAQTEEPG